MRLSEQEQKDLDAMKAEVARKKELFFDMCRTFDRASTEQLATMGYHNGPAEAMRSAFKGFQAHIDKLHKEYFKKYPD